MSVVLIDTTVFCNVVPVPGRDQNRNEVLTGLQTMAREKTTLLLPMAAVLETGNHIAHLNNGGLRRKTSELFCKQVLDAIEGSAPWTPTPFWENESLRNWLNQFPYFAMQGKGMGDLSIIKEWERQCDLHSARRVRIWSFDEHLFEYDRMPLL